MADYIYTMETRLSPDQLKAVSAVQDAAKAADMNLYLTGGAIRDIITGFPIRDLDFTVQGNALKLQKDLERAGAVVGDSDDETKALLLTFKRTLGHLEQVVESADVAPSPDALTAFQQSSQLMKPLLQDWMAIKEKDLPHLNELLRKGFSREPGISTLRG